MKVKIIKFFKSFSTYQWVFATIISLVLVACSIYYISSFSTSKVYNVDFSDIVTITEGDNQILELRGISLPKGTYAMAIGYAAPNDATFYALIDNDTTYNETWTSTKGELTSRSYEFELKSGTDRGRFVFTSNADSPLSLAFITIASDRHIYADGLLWGILALLLIPCMWIAIYFYGKSQHKFALAITIALVLAQALPFILTDGLIQGIDTRAHMMRIEGIYYGLMDGQFPVIVQPEFNNNYGQIGVLYPNVFLYVPAIFRLLRMSQLGVCKLYLFLIVGASGLVAFASARTIFKRDWQVALCTFAILIGNMRLQDLMTGGRIGGALLAELFYPLIIAGLIELLYHNRNKWYLVAFGIAGCFCCHVTSSTIACIFILLMTLFSLNKLSDTPCRKGIGRAILLFLGLTLGTVACFMQFYFTDWGQGNLQWSDFLSTLWNIYCPVAHNPWITLIASMFLIIALMIFLRLRLGKDDFRAYLKGNFVVPLFISATILLWMSTAYFPWGFLTRFSAIKYYTNMLQGAYRFIAIVGCAYAFCIPKLLQACVVSVTGRRSYQSKTVIVTCILLIVMGAINLGGESIHYLKSDDYMMLYHDEVIGEVEYAFDDYLPGGTQSEWYTSDTGYVSDESAVKSLAYEREGTYLYYSYTNSAEGSYVEFPKFYYNGYVAEDEMAEDVQVYKGDKNRVRVYLTVTEEPKIIRLWYHVPWYLTLACSLSMGLWIVSIMFLSAKVLNRCVDD